MKSVGTGQLKIQDVMKNKLLRSGNRVTKSIGLFIVKDMKPYSVVYHVVRIKNTLLFLHSRIEIIEIESR